MTFRGTPQGGKGTKHTLFQCRVDRVGWGERLYKEGKASRSVGERTGSHQGGWDREGSLRAASVGWSKTTQEEGRMLKQGRGRESPPMGTRAVCPVQVARGVYDAKAGVKWGKGKKGETWGKKDAGQV